MNYSETKKRKFQLESNIKKLTNDIEQANEDLRFSKEESIRVYKSVQDFTVDYVTTLAAKKKLGTLKAKQKSLETGIKNKEKSLQENKNDLTKLKENG